MSDDRQSVIEFTAATYIALATALGCERKSNAVLSELSNHASAEAAGFIQRLLVSRHHRAEADH